jgi:hypothetical protein
MKLFLAFITILNVAPAFATVQKFRMYSKPHTKIDRVCDVYTELKLNIVGDAAKATLTDKVSGLCEMYRPENKRSYTLELTKTDCGSRIYTWSDGGDREASIVDNRGRVCENLVPALIVVREINSDESTERVLYSHDH